MLEISNYKKQILDQLTYMQQFLAPLSDSELNWNQGENWSIIQIAEHILLTEETVIAMLEKGSEHMSERIELFGGDKLRKLLVDYRERKVKAPSSLIPMGSIRTSQEFQQALLKCRTDLIDKLESNEIMISTEVHIHPMLGEMTVSDWLNFIQMHAERHFYQMKERFEQIKVFKEAK